MKHYGDITKINGAEVEPVEIITGGSPCFIKGSLVSTENGLKPIEEVNIGESVLTHNNHYRRVKNQGCTGVKPTAILKGMGFDKIQATLNHPFYARKMERVYQDGKNIRTFGKPEWVGLKDLTKKHYLGVAINNKSENPYDLDENDCWLIGRFIADGYVRNEQRPNRKEGCKFHSVIFCIGKAKSVDFNNHLGKYKAGVSKERAVDRYTISSKRLTDLCEKCGKGAANKHLPQFLIDLPTDLLKSVLGGYMAGDGCFSQGKYKATSVSRKLVYTIGQAVAKVYHAPYSIYEIEVPEKKVIEGRSVNQNTQYQITFKTDKRKQDKAFYEDGYVWFPVKSVEQADEQEVYNLSVEEDESYCIQNIIVHNCQDLSVAGKRAGLAGERSGLFMEQIRIIKEMRENDRRNNGRSGVDVRPRFMVWENVFGVFSSNKGEDFRAVLEEIVKVKDKDAIIPEPPKGKWSNAGCIMGDGWSVAWRVHDAQYWGVPQRRRRLCVLADFNGDTAPKILFELQ